MLIGPKGAEIEKIRGEVEKLIGKPVSIDIVEIKAPDLNAGSVEAAMSMIAGTARSMGVVVGD